MIWDQFNQVELSQVEFHSEIDRKQTEVNILKLYQNTSSET